MIPVAETSALVAELLRIGTSCSLTHPDLRVVVAEEHSDETQHELQRRIGVIAEQGPRTDNHAKERVCGRHGSDCLWQGEAGALDCRDVSTVEIGGPGLDEQALHPASM